MIVNPPAAIHILREHKLLLRSEVGIEHATRHLAVVIARLVGILPYREFLTYWHLYLQAIPFEIACAAWGITASTGAGTRKPAQ